MAVVLKKAKEIATEPLDAGEGKLSLVDVIAQPERSEEHTSELQSPCNLVCRLLLEKKQRTVARPKTKASGRRHEISHSNAMISLNAWQHHQTMSVSLFLILVPARAITRRDPYQVLA